MLKNKVIEFYVEPNDFYLKFAQQLKNYSLLENLTCKKRHRKS